MVTLPGGSSLTVEISESASQYISDFLVNNSVKLDLKTEVAQANPAPLQEQVVFGPNTSFNAVNSTVVTGGDSSLIQFDANVGTGSLLNVGVSGGSVVLSGTQAGSVTAAFMGGGDLSTTRIAVGDSGQNFFIVEDSRNTIIATGSGNDSIIGGGGQDHITVGDSGIVYGGAGNDTIIGGTGSSILSGADGNDSIIAGSGDSTIIGGTGNDTLVAGAGKDIFIYSPGDGNDTIIGFDATQDTLGFASTAFQGGTLDLGALIQNATVSNGNTILTLPDGSTITVAGVADVSLNWFTVK